MATTSPDNIKTPDAGDQYALVQDLGAMADTVQNALVKRANSYKGTSTQRNSFTTAPEGTSWVDTNGDKASWVRQSGTWVRLSGQVTLWSGTPVFLTDIQTLTLSQSVSSQPNGIILAWSKFGTSAEDSDWNLITVPKRFLAAPGTGVSMPTYSGSTLARKYVYVSDTTLQGIAGNGTGDARGTVLRYVWGF